MSISLDHSKVTFCINHSICSYQMNFLGERQLSNEVMVYLIKYGESLIMKKKWRNHLVMVYKELNEK
jgi:hypothetical protein